MARGCIRAAAGRAIGDVWGAACRAGRPLLGLELLLRQRNRNRRILDLARDRLNGGQIVASSNRLRAGGSHGAEQTAGEGTDHGDVGAERCARGCTRDAGFEDSLCCPRGVLGIHGAGHSAHDGGRLSYCRFGPGGRGAVAFRESCGALAGLGETHRLADLSSHHAAH